MWYLFSIHTLLNTRINWEKRRDGHVLPVGIHDLITDFTEASQASPRCLEHLSSLLKQLRDCFRSFSVVAPNCLTLYYLFLWFSLHLHYKYRWTGCCDRYTAHPQLTCQISDKASHQEAATLRYPWSKAVSEVENSTSTCIFASILTPPNRHLVSK